MNYDRLIEAAFQFFKAKCAKKPPNQPSIYNYTRRRQPPPKLDEIIYIKISELKSDVSILLNDHVEFEKFKHMWKQKLESQIEAKLYYLNLILKLYGSPDYIKMYRTGFEHVITKHVINEIKALDNTNEIKTINNHFYICLIIFIVIFLFVFRIG